MKNVLLFLLLPMLSFGNTELFEEEFLVDPSSMYRTAFGTYSDCRGCIYFSVSPDSPPGWEKIPGIWVDRTVYNDFLDIINRAAKQQKMIAINGTNILKETYNYAPGFGYIRFLGPDKPMEGHYLRITTIPRPYEIFETKEIKRFGFFLQWLLNASGRVKKGKNVGVFGLNHFESIKKNLKQAKQSGQRVGVARAALLHPDNYAQKMHISNPIHDIWLVN